MSRKQPLLAVGLVLLVVLAGCGGADTGGTPSASDPGGETGTDPGTSAVPDDASDRAVDAIASVETYHVEATETRRYIGAQTQVIELQQGIDVNRTARRLHRTENRTVAGRTVAVDTYLLNETVYQRSAAFVRQFSAEWIRINASGNFSRAFRVADPLDRQARILETATFEANGTETIDGREAYRIETDADPEALEDLFAELIGGPTSGFNGSTYSLETATYTFWIDAETNRPLRVAGTLESRVSFRGREVTLRQSFRFAYAYDAAVSVDLPEAASSAVPLSEALNATSPGA